MYFRDALKIYQNRKLFRAINDKTFCTITNFSADNSSKWQKPNGHDTGIQIYNCVAREKVPLIVRNKNCVTWYTCGPTVYDLTHLGHAVCYMKIDIIQRILKNYFQLNLITAMNITDIDDKIIARSKEKNENWLNLSKHYEDLFWIDMYRLGIQKADIILNVKNSIDSIIEFVHTLLKDDRAYVADDGSVYFRNRNKSKLQILGDQKQSTVKNVSVRESITDFALWKASKPNEPSWQVPWNSNSGASTNGRPGWHSECSAMASTIFGNQIDIHAGGIDLRFPHHENEESQCCAFHKTNQWVNYWLHIGHLVTTDNVKMSKSLKNTITIDEMLKHYKRDHFRMACLITSYPEHIQFDNGIMNESVKLLNRFSSFLDDTQNYVNNKEMHRSLDNYDELYNQLNETTIEIDHALKNDFNLTKCIFILTELMSTLNRTLTNTTSNINSVSNNNRENCIEIVQSAQNIVKNFLQICGFDDTLRQIYKYDVNESQNDSINVNKLIDDIIEYRCELRNTAKLTKNNNLFEISTKLRDIFNKHNIEIKDLKITSSWRMNDSTKTK